jgi:hypothetical protein
MAEENVVDGAATEGNDQVADGQAVTTDTSKTQTQTSTTKEPAGNGGTTGQPAFDAQKSYEALLKNYKELQGHSTQTSQERAELRKELAAIREALSKSLEKPFDPEQFKRDFETHGPKALDSYLEKRLQEKLDEVRKTYDERISGYETELGTLKTDSLGLRTNYEVLVRANDAQNYPNFAELYPVMMAMVQEEKCPVDVSKPVPEILDGLYKLAKERSSNDAVQIAAAKAKKDADANAANESRSTVATGGKTASTSVSDPRTMSLDKLAAEIGTIDRG